MKIPLTLGYDSDERKRTPLLATVFGYFAAAMAGLARHCVRSNEKHNKGEPVHWARGKSMDHAECSLRHLIDAEEMKAWLGRNPEHSEREAVITMLEHEYDARVWRAAADAQEFYEEFRNAPLAFNARLPIAAPPEPTCSNCGTPVPPGCSGANLDDGAPCALFPREQADAAAVAFVAAVSAELPAPSPPDVRGCPDGFDRTTWPPVFTPVGPYPCVWIGRGGLWFWETAIDISPSFGTEAAARAAYWADVDPVALCGHPNINGRFKCGREKGHPGEHVDT